MKYTRIFLVRPHPPVDILQGDTPIPDSGRYHWEPMALKLIALALHRVQDLDPDIEIWHLTSPKDEADFYSALRDREVHIVVFSEIDILVTAVTRMASHIKKYHSGIVTIAGGKQTSLLSPGDRFPFRGIDHAFRGDGCTAIPRAVVALQAEMALGDIEGYVHVDDSGMVREPLTYAPRHSLDNRGLSELSSIPVHNHSFAEYVHSLQNFPSLSPDPVPTATLPAGIGCAYSCSFCQSPREYGADSHKVYLSPPGDLAHSVELMLGKEASLQFFSLEANMNLFNAAAMYKVLDQRGINKLSYAGFIRVSDVLQAHQKGILSGLAAQGMRFLSIGLDIPGDSQRDIYNKSFSYDDIRQCLKVCEEAGIIVLATFVGDPDLTPDQYHDQLEILSEYPVAEVDVRLAMALRSTPYFIKNRKYLIYDPDHSGQEEWYYNRQNYRYQTLQFPGKIEPEETYRLTLDFLHAFKQSNTYLHFADRMMDRFPETIHYFSRNSASKKLKGVS